MGIICTRNICVYCGSRKGRRPEYKMAARDLAQALVARGMGLVYGGGRVGLMGELADAVLAAGGKVTGVIPAALREKELAHNGLTQLIVTHSMHERKTVMAEHSSAFIALPGGIGTLEELFEMWTWGQLELHRKPYGLLNVAGYYDRLVAFLDAAVQEEFLHPTHRALLAIESSPISLLDRFETIASCR